MRPGLAVRVDPVRLLYLPAGKMTETDVLLCEKRSKEAQESTNYIIDEEIHAPCGSESVNATLHQIFEEK